MIADAIAAACDDPDVLACLGGPTGEAARAKEAELRRLPAAAKKQARALAAALARATTTRGIHPSWIEAALGGLPARARAELAAPSFDPSGVWLARWAFAALAPMPAPDLSAPRAIHDVVRLSAEALVAWLSDVGADQLAFAVGASRFVEPHVLARIARPPRAGKLGDRRAAIARCQVDLDDDALLRIGARTIAPHTDAFTRRRIALRLPRTRGMAVLFELQTAVVNGLDASPTWDAITAPTQR